jgi:hypothetical protein
LSKISRKAPNYPPFPVRPAERSEEAIEMQDSVAGSLDVDADGRDLLSGVGCVEEV